MSYEIDFRIIKERARLETVLRHYGLGAQPRRSQYFILCPFHRETEPSCRINSVRNRFRCFGCGAKGSILDFVARLERIGIKRAAELSHAGVLTGRVMFDSVQTRSRSGRTGPEKTDRSGSR